VWNACETCVKRACNASETHVNAFHMRSTRVLHMLFTCVSHEFHKRGEYFEKNKIKNGNILLDNCFLNLLFFKLGVPELNGQKFGLPILELYVSSIFRQKSFNKKITK
jgi:hypothetical protein